MKQISTILWLLLTSAYLVLPASGSAGAEELSAKSKAAIAPGTGSKSIISNASNPVEPAGKAADSKLKESTKVLGKNEGNEELRTSKALGKGSAASPAEKDKNFSSKQVVKEQAAAHSIRGSAGPKEVVAGNGNKAQQTGSDKKSVAGDKVSLPDLKSAAAADKRGAASGSKVSALGADGKGNAAEGKGNAAAGSKGNAAESKGNAAAGSKGNAAESKGNAAESKGNAAGSKGNATESKSNPAVSKSDAAENKSGAARENSGNHINRKTPSSAGKHGMLVPPPPPIVPTLSEMGMPGMGATMIFVGENIDYMPASDLRDLRERTNKEIVRCKEKLTDMTASANDKSQKASSFDQLFAEGVISRRELEASKKESETAGKDMEDVKQALTVLEQKLVKIDQRFAVLNKPKKAAKSAKTSTK